jgi:hypothetical protein
LRKSIFSARPNSFADARIIGHFTGSRQSQFNGAVRARTLAGIGYTLQHIDPVHSDRSEARKSPRAIVILDAGPAAEASRTTVIDTGIVGPAAAGAIATHRAGAAQVGEARYANVDNVGVSSRDLLALPSRWAFLLTALGADPFPHVLNTPPRLAVAVFRALVEEAAFTCFAIEQHLGHRIRAQEVWHLINSRI